MGEYYCYNNILPSKSIRTAICANIKGDSRKYLIYVCNNNLNVCHVTRDGIVADCSRHALFMDIMEIREYIPEKLIEERGKENVKSYILALTKSYLLLLLEFDVKLNDFIPISEVSFDEKKLNLTAEDALFLLDERHRTILFYGFRNIIKYIYLDYDDYFNLNNLHTLRVDEGTIIDVTFLSSNTTEELKRQRRIRTYRENKKGNKYGETGVKLNYNEINMKGSDESYMRKQKQESENNKVESMNNLNESHVANRHFNEQLERTEKNEETEKTLERNKCIKDNFLDALKTTPTTDEFFSNKGIEENINQTPNYLLSKNLHFLDDGKEKEKKNEEGKEREKEKENSLEKNNNDDIPYSVTNNFTSNIENKKTFFFEEPFKGPSIEKERNEEKILDDVAELIKDAEIKRKYEKNKKGNINTKDNYVRKSYSNSFFNKISKHKAIASICILYDPLRRVDGENNRYIKILLLDICANDKNIVNNNNNNNNNENIIIGNSNNNDNSHFDDSGYDNDFNSGNKMTKHDPQYENCMNEDDLKGTKKVSVNYSFTHCVDSTINKILSISKNRLLLLGFQFINYIDLEKKNQKNFYLNTQLRTIRCVERVNHRKFLLGDDYGDLFLLTCTYKAVDANVSISAAGASLSKELMKGCFMDGRTGRNENLHTLKLQHLGNSSKSHVLVSIHSDIVFLGSLVSNSYLLRLHNTPTEEVDPYFPVEPAPRNYFDGDKYDDDNRKHSFNKDIERMQMSCCNCYAVEVDSAEETSGKAKAKETEIRDFLNEDQFNVSLKINKKSLSLEKDLKYRCEYLPKENKTDTQEMNNTSNTIPSKEKVSPDILKHDNNFSRRNEMKQIAEIEENQKNIKNIECQHGRRSVSERKKKYIETLSVIPNLGPILDFCIIENKNENKEIITCNSYGMSGCISIIHNGLKNKIISEIDIGNITNFFVVKYVIHLKKKDGKREKMHHVSSKPVKSGEDGIYDNTSVNDNMVNRGDWNNADKMKKEHHYMNAKKSKRLEFQAYAVSNSKNSMLIENPDLCFLNKYYFDNENEINILKYSNLIYFHVFMICVTYGHHTKIIGVCRERGKKDERKSKELKEIDKNCRLGYAQPVNTSVYNYEQYTSGFFLTKVNESSSYKSNKNSSGKSTNNNIELCEYENTDIFMNGNTVYFGALKRYPFLIQITNDSILLLCCLSLKKVFELKLKGIMRVTHSKDLFFIYCNVHIFIYTVIHRTLICLYTYKVNYTVTAMTVYKNMLGIVYENKKVVLYHVYMKRLELLRKQMEEKNKKVSIQNESREPQECPLKNDSTEQHAEMDELEKRFGCTFLKVINVYRRSTDDFFSFITAVEIIEMNYNIYLFVGYNTGLIEYFVLCDYSHKNCFPKKQENGIRKKKSNGNTQHLSTMKEKETCKVPFLDFNKNNDFSDQKKIEESAAVNDIHEEKEKECNRELSVEKKNFDDKVDLLDLHKSFLKKKKCALKYIYRGEWPKIENKSEIFNGGYTEGNKSTHSIEKENMMKKCEDFLEKNKSTMECKEKKKDNNKHGENVIESVKKKNVTNDNDDDDDDDDDDDGLDENNKLNLQKDLEKRNEIKRSKNKLFKYLSDHHTNIYNYFDFQNGTFKDVRKLHEECIRNKNAEISVKTESFYNTLLENEDFVSLDDYIRTINNQPFFTTKKEESEKTKEKYIVDTLEKNSFSLEYPTHVKLSNEHEKKGNMEKCNDIKKEEDNLQCNMSDINILNDFHDDIEDGNLSDQYKEIKLNRKKAKYFFQFYETYAVSSDESSGSDRFHFCTFKDDKKKVSKGYRGDRNKKKKEIVTTGEMPMDEFDFENELFTQPNFENIPSFCGSYINETRKREDTAFDSEAFDDFLVYPRRNIQKGVKFLEDKNALVDMKKQKEKEGETVANSGDTTVDVNQEESRLLYNETSQLNEDTNISTINMKVRTNKRKRQSSYSDIFNGNEKNDICEENVLNELFCNKISIKDVKKRKNFLNKLINKKLSGKINKYCDVQESNISDKDFFSEDYSSDISCFGNMNNFFFDEEIYLKNNILKSKNILLTNKREIHFTQKPIQFKKFSKVIVDKKKLNVQLGSVAKKQHFLFVCGDEPLVIHSKIRKNISISKLSIKNVYLVDIFNDFHYLNPFHNSALFKKKNLNNFYFILFDGKKLYITHLNEIKNVYLQKIPFYRTVDKIAYHPESRLLLAACPSEERYKTNEYMSQIICFFDPYFHDKGKYTFTVPEKYNISTVCIYTIDEEIAKTIDTKIKTLVLVGTAYVDEKSIEPLCGSMYVFMVQTVEGITDIKHLYTYTTCDGGITNLKQFRDKVVASVNNMVVILDMSELLKNMNECIRNSESATIECKYELINDLASFTPCTWITSMDIFDDYIIVGDLMTSVIVLSYEEEMKKLNEVCRDFSAIWCSSVVALSKNYFLISDIHCNFFILQKWNVKHNDESFANLTVVSTFNHDSVINKMLPIFSHNFIKQEDDIDKILLKTKSTLCASTDGSISAIIPFSNLTNFKKALCIEVALNDNAVPLGNYLTHDSVTEYKLNSLSKNSRGIVDGELLKIFFQLPFEKQLRTYIFAKWTARQLNCKFGNFESFVLDIENICRFL